MKTHIKGTNNRTFCGHKITHKMILLLDNERWHRANCESCLLRLKDSHKFLLECFEELKNLKRINDE